MLINIYGKLNEVNLFSRCRRKESNLNIINSIKSFVVLHKMLSIQTTFLKMLFNE